MSTTVRLLGMLEVQGHYGLGFVSRLACEAFGKP